MDTNQHLQRFTTVYVDLEDRIRLAGELQNGRTLVFLLTQRMLTNLLPHLFQWLQQETQGSYAAQSLQGFAQQVALAHLEAQAPVQTGTDSKSYLVSEINVAHDADNLVLTFKSSESTAVRLALTSTPLRQWLSIVREQCSLARWPQEMWPTWLAPGTEHDAHAQMTVH